MYVNIICSWLGVFFWWGLGMWGYGKNEWAFVFGV